MTKPTAHLLPKTYHPTKAEQEEQVHVPSTPEALAKAVTRSVNVRMKDVAQHRRERPARSR